MKTKLVLCSLTFSLAAAFAGSNSHNVTLSSPVWVGTTELQPGDYKVAMSGDKAVFTKDKQVVEAPAMLASGPTKFGTTAVISNDSKLQEIDLGGSNAKIVLGGAIANGN